MGSCGCTTAYTVTLEVTLVVVQLQKHEGGVVVGGREVILPENKLRCFQTTGILYICPSTSKLHDLIQIF